MYILNKKRDLIMQYGYARGSIINMNLNRDIEVPNINEIRSFVEDTPQLMENLRIRDNMNFFLYP